MPKAFLTPPNRKKILCLLLFPFLSLPPFLISFYRKPIRNYFGSQLGIMLEANWELFLGSQRKPKEGNSELFWCGNVHQIATPQGVAIWWKFPHPGVAMWWQCGGNILGTLSDLLIFTANLMRYPIILPPDCHQHCHQIATPRVWKFPPHFHQHFHQITTPGVWKCGGNFHPWCGIMVEMSTTIPHPQKHLGQPIRNYFAQIRNYLRNYSQIPNSLPKNRTPAIPKGRETN